MNNWTSSVAPRLQVLKSRGGVFLVLVLNACSDAAPRAGIPHPANEWLVHSIEPRGALRLDTDAPLSSTAALPARMGHTRQMIEIGTEDAEGGSAQTVFGEVRGALTIPSLGKVIVLDGMAREIRAFDLSSGVAETVARSGAGPGALLRPTTLRTSRLGYILAFEATGRISFFNIAGDSIGFSHRIELRGEIVDACVLGDLLYIHGRRVEEAEVIHVFDMDGTAINSFGVVYSSPNNLVRFQLSRGRIACSEAMGVVVFAPAHLPEVRAYTPSGELLWWWSIEGFRHIGLEEFRRPEATRMWLPDDGFHMTTGLVPSLSGDEVAVQVTDVQGRVSRYRRDPSNVHTFVLSASGESADYLGNDGDVLHEWGRTHLISSRLEDFPQLIVRLSSEARWGGSGTGTSPQVEQPEEQSFQ